jgi:hypothetical protein
MSDYLERIAVRNFSAPDAICPRPLSAFESGLVEAGAASGSVDEAPATERPAQANSTLEIAPLASPAVPRDPTALESSPTAASGAAFGAASQNRAVVSGPPNAKHLNTAREQKAKEKEKERVVSESPTATFVPELPGSPAQPRPRAGEPLIPNAPRRSMPVATPVLQVRGNAAPPVRSEVLIKHLHNAGHGAERPFSESPAQPVPAVTKPPHSPSLKNFRPSSPTAMSEHDTEVRGVLSPPQVEFQHRSPRAASQAPEPQAARVTIGRVEVRASVTPAPTPSRRTSPAATMSLADYLKHRARGGGT